MIGTLFFNWSWCKSAYSSNRPCVKQLAFKGMEAKMSPKKHRRPLPCLLYKSFFNRPNIPGFVHPTQTQNLHNTDSWFLSKCVPKILKTRYVKSVMLMCVESGGGPGMVPTGGCFDPSWQLNRISDQIRRRDLAMKKLSWPGSPAIIDSRPLLYHQHSSHLLPSVGLW